MIEFDAAGRLARAELEFISIADTFDRIGEGRLAAQATSLYGLEARMATERLASLLGLLFEQTRAGRIRGG